MEIEPKFAEAITNTQVAKQDVYQAQFEQRVLEVEASTELAVSTQLREIKIETANNKAKEIIAVADAEAEIIINTIDAQIQAYLNLSKSLNLNSPSELLSYLWLQAMQNNQAKDLILSMDYPSLLKT
eukprot:TRINITY_DN8014_c0_g1_i1.p1 TRINITY_DN8014_c0_g1~~TRINITY_DN8014_c0_g1_i1.p1  ORF type:complete len:127 (-),score=15.69 TRINITY_DN8014_c0_g1_i1:228-608(-)